MSDAGDTSDRRTRGEPVVVGVGGLDVATYPDTLLTRALGSCVGLTMWDPVTRSGGMAHIMLPDAGPGRGDREPTRAATFAVPVLVRRLTGMGCDARRLEVKIAGGAAMFPSDPVHEGIGSRNLTEVMRQLALLDLTPKAEDVGGSHARTIELMLGDGALVVRSYVFGLRTI